MMWSTSWPLVGIAWGIVVLGLHNVIIETPAYIFCLCNDCLKFFGLVMRGDSGVIIISSC